MRTKKIIKIYNIKTMELFYYSAEDYKDFLKLGFKLPSKENAIKGLTNFLILHLYEPESIKNGQKIPDKKKLKKYKLQKEKINWQELECRKVERDKNYFLVYINGVKPVSINFNNYIKSWLEKWGWKVVIINEL